MVRPYRSMQARNSGKRAPLRRIGPLAALSAGLLLAGGALAVAAQEDAAPGDYIVVRHVLYITDDGSTAIEQESSSRVSAAFVVNDHVWDVDDIPIQVTYNPADAPAGHDVPALFQDAMNTWNAAGSGFAFQWAGESTSFTGACATSPQIDGKNNIKFTPLPPLVLGQTCTVYPPPKNSNTKLVEFDMQLNPAINWSSTLPVPAGRYDIATTILHELGHAAGIGHACGGDVGIGCDGEHEPTVMYPTLVTGVSKRSLTQDDIDAIREAYGSVVTPTATMTASSTPTVTPPTTTPPTATPTTPPAQQLFERARAPLLARD